MSRGTRALTVDKGISTSGFYGPDSAMLKASFDHHGARGRAWRPPLKRSTGSSSTCRQPSVRASWPSYRPWLRTSASASCFSRAGVSTNAKLLVRSTLDFCRDCADPGDAPLVLLFQLGRALRDLEATADR